MPQDIKDGQLRVIWMSNIPSGKQEEFYVDTVEQAKLVLAALSIHDLNLGESLVHSNMSSLEVYRDGEVPVWEEWEDEDYEPVNTDDQFDMLKGLHLNLL